MTLIANLFVCALVLTALAAFWILVCVWLDRDKIQDHHGTLVRDDDPRADKSVDPVVKHRDYEEYPLKPIPVKCCPNCNGHGLVEEIDGEWVPYRTS